MEDERQRINDVLSLLEKLGFVRKPTETIRQYVTRIQVDPRLSRYSEKLFVFVQLYEDAFYGPPPLEKSESLGWIIDEIQAWLTLLLYEREKKDEEWPPLRKKAKVKPIDRVARPVEEPTKELRRSGLVVWVFLGSLLLVFFSLSSFKVTLPGMFIEEGLDYYHAVYLMLGDKVSLRFYNVEPPLRFPILRALFNYGTYHAGNGGTPIHTWTVVPFFYLLGINVVSSRLHQILFGMVTLALVFFFCKEMFNIDIACVAGILVATSPYYIFWVRMGGWTCESTKEIFLIMATLLALFRWKESGKLRYALMSSLLFGLGVSSKINYMYLPAYLILAYVLFRPKLRVEKRWIPLLLLFFFIGSFPFWLNELYFNPGQTPGFYLRESQHTPVSDPGKIILMRFDQIRGLLEGRFCWLLPMEAPGTRNTPALVLFLFLTAFGLVSTSMLLIKDIAQHRQNSFNKSSLFMFLLFGFFFFSTVYTGGSYPNEFHLLIISTFPEILMSISLFLLLSLLSKKIDEKSSKKLRMLGMGIFLTVLVFSNMFIITDRYAHLERTGGTGLFSDAIYELADYLVENNVEKPIAVDWNFIQLVIITGGKVDPVDITYASRDLTPSQKEVFMKNCKSLFADPNRVYLFHSERYTWFTGHFPLFEQAAKSMNKSVVLLKTFYQRDGEPIILVYSVQQQPDFGEVMQPTHSTSSACGSKILKNYHVSDYAVYPERRR